VKKCAARILKPLISKGENMNRSTIAAGVLLFVLGVALGNFLPNRRVSAQEMPQQQNDWVITTTQQGPHFDAYIFNTRTGEAFRVEGAPKTPVKLKP
jgi:hypothetical protein